LRRVTNKRLEGGILLYRAQSLWENITSANPGDPEGRTILIGRDQVVTKPLIDGSGAAVGTHLLKIQNEIPKIDPLSENARKRGEERKGAICAYGWRWEGCF